LDIFISGVVQEYEMNGQHEVKEIGRPNFYALLVNICAKFLYMYLTMYTFHSYMSTLKHTDIYKHKLEARALFFLASTRETARFHTSQSSTCYSSSWYKFYIHKRSVQNVPDFSSYKPRKS